MSLKRNYRAKGLDVPKMTIKNWVMVIIYDKGVNRPRDPLTLMNEVFIFVKEILPIVEHRFYFDCTGYGPYCEKVAKSVNQLLSTNILEIREDKSLGPGGYGYSLTESGIKKAERLYLKLPEHLRDKMEFMKTATTSMGLSGMLQYIQSIYPEFIYLQEGGETIV